MTFVLVLMQVNWDRMTKKYGDTQEGAFIKYVTTLVSLRPHFIFNPRKKSMYYTKVLTIDGAPLFLVISSPPTRRQQSSPASLPPVGSLNSREH